jgi:hypothetical protein
VKQNNQLGNKKQIIMKKTITMVLLVSSLLSFTNVKGQSFNQPTNYKLQISPTLLGAIAGGGFIIAGVLTTPEKKWVQDNTSNSSTFYGQQGHWEKQKVWESQSRMAAIISGALIMSLTITLSF